MKKLFRIHFKSSGHPGKRSASRIDLRFWTSQNDDCEMRATQKGFTFIELLIVIVLIGGLATWLLILINPASQLRKGRDVQRKADLRQIQAGLELYRADQNIYPASLPSCGSALTVGGATYMRQIPCDPRNTGQYVYRYTTTGGTSYNVIACLENTADPQKDTTNNTTYCTGGTTNWSYTVKNP